jgi:uncharacterized protein (TIGR03437 family)
VDPDQPDTLVAATPDGLFKSSDGAASWTRVTGSGAAFSVETHDPFALLSHRCAPAGALAAMGSGPGSFRVAFSPDYGATWMTPQLTNVTAVTAGPSCAVYVTRQGSSDAFVARLAPDGTALWTTYLGGADQDAPVALVLDAQGNAYVAGNTTSPDFPSTVPRIGPAGQGAVFVAKFTPDGRLQYSALISGEARDTETVLAVDRAGDAYVAGSTDSQSFPVTPGAFVSKVDPGNYTGFLVKLSPAATLVYATYLGISYTYPGAILANDDGTTIVAGLGPAPGSPPGQGYSVEFVMKLDPAASQVLSSTYLQGASPYFSGPTGLATDGAGNLFVAGETAGGPVFPGTPGYTSPQLLTGCPENLHSNPTGADLFVVKLAAADWTPVYSARLSAPCGIKPGAMVVDAAGSAIVAMAAGRGLPLHDPLLAGPTCFLNSSAVARLSPDGSALQSATYLDNCGIPGIALAPDGSIYAGVSPSRSRNPAGVLHLAAAVPPAISLDQVANAFSGNTNAVAYGGLYTLTGTGFQFPAIDLGLNATQDLPLTLGGVQVQFDGVPAPILQTAPGRVIVVAPPPAGGRHEGGTRGFTTLQLVANGFSSNIVRMPVAASLPGLLTWGYFNPPQVNFADGAVYNADGTPNDANHPAAAGSTITLFATGMGAAVPPPVPGSIAHSQTIVPVTPVYSSLQTYPIGGMLVPLPVSSVPGFVSALFQIGAQIPSNIQKFGTPLDNGVRRLAMALQFALAPSTALPPASNYISVYAK